jgi:hypothetical protein
MRPRNHKDYSGSGSKDLNFVTCELTCSDEVETCWVIGGLSVYAEALDHPGKEDNMYNVGTL